MTFVRKEPSPWNVLATITLAVMEDARKIAVDTVLMLMRVAAFT